MTGIIPRLKRLFMEPHVYAVLLQSRKGAILHLGVHYSLDEAIEAGTPTLLSLAPHKNGDNVVVEMWTVLKGGDAARKLLDSMSLVDSGIKMGQPQHTVTAKNDVGPREQLKNLRSSKNKFMKALIEAKDLAAVEASKDILSKSERAFIIDKIQSKH